MKFGGKVSSCQCFLKGDKTLCITNEIYIYIYVFPSKASSVVFVVSVVFVGSVSAVKIGEAGMGKVSTWQPHAVANGRRR